MLSVIGLKQSLSNMRTEQSWLEDEGVLIDRTAREAGFDLKVAVKHRDMPQAIPGPIFSYRLF